MSIIKNPYEISVWEDVWDSGSQRFTENKICIIGSDTMDFGGRALNPSFTRNVNGKKTLSFSMYKNFIDTQTGETIENPFVKFLISERKVKLKYKGQWHDFLVKTITENSTKSENTYELEDAMVNELAKNGFGLTLADELNNSIGTAKQLGEYILENTDWKVESEALVEKIEEGLVYVSVPAGTKLTHLVERQDDVGGIGEDSKKTTLDKKTTVLAFYSSCRGKPHRFQLIYANGGVYGKDGKPTLNRDDERIITEAECQYYFEVDKPSTYVETEDSPTFYLPEGWSLAAAPKGDTSISTWYRGERYGFAQQTKYLPKIDKYVYVYDAAEGSSTDNHIYGYQRTKYSSPSLISNYAAGSLFKSTSGWITSDSDNCPREIVVGRFDNGFVALEKDISEGKYSKHKPSDYKSYLKYTYKNSNAFLLNSGPKDNRRQIGEMPKGSSWAVGLEILNSSGEKINLSKWKITIEECVWSAAEEGWKSKDSPIIKLSHEASDEDFRFYLVGMKCSSAAFKKNSSLYIKIQPPALTSNKEEETYYISKIQFFEATYDNNGKLIVPDDYTTQADNAEQSTTTKSYVFFDEKHLKNATSEDDLVLLSQSSKLDYTTYKPTYNDGAQKVRTVEAKESNYFNILQSIAEKFECWLELIVEHDGEGRIKTKTVKFKNYVGSTNNACFRYGLNLKDIKRTYESKNIVSKLYVKSNSNEFADNGFCTIQRAAANETGESFICDLQYYLNTELISEEVIADINKRNQAIKEQNDAYTTAAQKYNEISADLVKLRAKQEIAEAAVESANDAMEELSTTFEETYNAKITGNNTNGSTLNYERSDVVSELRKYALYQNEYNTNLVLKNELDAKIKAQEKSQENLSKTLEDCDNTKKKKLRDFYTIYSRYLQEGTWNSEDYTDDNKYYNDAKSVLYNSCYPQVAYSINVVGLNCLPGYELLDFDIGDQTHVIDPEFFGDQFQEEVVITEMTEALDNPTANTIKVQNFKNQFQDLFQKITATVQQTQYSTGAYQKAVALSESDAVDRLAFLDSALGDASAKLTAAGEQSVVWDSSGLTITDLETPSHQVRMVGGAMLLSKQNEKTGETEWRTGITADGISADLITAGRINTGEISIMKGNDRSFVWDADGLKAYADSKSPDKYALFSKDGLSVNRPNEPDNSQDPYAISVFKLETKEDENGEKKQELTKTFSVDLVGNVQIAGSSTIGGATFDTTISGLENKTKEAQDAANGAQKSADKAQSTADEAKSAAGKAQTSADAAQSTAEEKVSKNLAFTDNGKFRWDFIESENSEVKSPIDGTTKLGTGMHMWRQDLDDGSIIELLRADKNGLTVNGEGTFSGKITAKEGQIGGWTISDEKDGSLYCGEYTNPDALISPPSYTEVPDSEEKIANAVLRVGQKTGGKYFQVDADGVVRIGNAISWGAGASPVLVLYAKLALDSPEDGTIWSKVPEEDESGWHTVKTINDRYASYTYDGGATWTAAIQIEATDGIDGVSPYTITLSNDFATIGTNSEGGGYTEETLKKLTQTVVQVYAGNINISDECKYSWTVSENCKIQGSDTSQIYFERLDADEGVATVSVKYNNKEIGIKTFKVVKNKQGKSAISYSLAVSPNSFNKTKNDSITPEFIVMKYDGSAAALMDKNGYTIKTKGNEENFQKYSDTPISDTTTFYLFIGEDDFWVDCETVDAVENGENGKDGQNGENGKDGDSVSTVYAYLLTSNKAPSTPTITSQLSTPTSSSGVWCSGDSKFKTTTTYPYVFRSEGKKTISNGNVSYSNWQTPLLYRALYIDSEGEINPNVNEHSYAEYLRTTNFNTDGIYADESGKLYISASALTVHDEGGKNIFYANGADKTVQIGGFSIDSTSLTTESADFEKQEKVKMKIDANKGVSYSTKAIKLENGETTVFDNYIKEDSIATTTSTKDKTLSFTIKLYNFLVDNLLDFSQLVLTLSSESDSELDPKTWYLQRGENPEDFTWKKEEAYYQLEGGPLSVENLALLQNGKLAIDKISYKYYSDENTEWVEQSSLDLDGQIKLFQGNMILQPTKINWGIREEEGYGIAANSKLTKPIRFGNDIGFIAIPSAGNDSSMGNASIVIRQHAVIIGDQMLIPNTASATNWSNTGTNSDGLDTLRTKLKHNIVATIHAKTSEIERIEESVTGIYFNPAATFTNDTITANDLQANNIVIGFFTVATVGSETKYSAWARLSNGGLLQRIITPRA